MDKYEHIKKHEKTLVEFSKKVTQLSQLLEFFENNQKDFEALIEYYYSQQRYQDLDDDEKGLIPDTIKRGVLSQDEIYNLYSDYRDVSTRMLELGTDFFKNN